MTIIELFLLSLPVVTAIVYNQKNTAVPHLCNISTGSVLFIKAKGVPKEIHASVIKVKRS